MSERLASCTSTARLVKIFLLVEWMTGKCTHVSSSAQYAAAVRNEPIASSNSHEEREDAIEGIEGRVREKINQQGYLDSEVIE